MRKYITKASERIGVESTSRDGKRAQVVSYSTCENFIIRFCDGKEMKLKNWRYFIEGNFNYEKHFKAPRNREERIGEKKVMNNGLTAEVIEYRGSHDMDILFEDGEKRTGVSWRDFCIGSIAHPTIPGGNVSQNELVLRFYLESLGFVRIPQRSKRSDRVGLEGKELDLYNDKLKIAIEYDGEYSHTKNKDDEGKNKIVEKLGIKLYRFREPGCSGVSGRNYILEDSRFMSASLECCLKSFVRDVLKKDDKFINFEKDKRTIKEYVSNNKRATIHLYEKKKMNNGMVAEIIKMSSCRNITVQFEDGEIVYHKCYQSFVKGNISHMQISALEVWHVNNEENNSQMCSLESGSADENIETMKAYMCKQRGMHFGSKISREEITKKVNQSKYGKYCYITNRLRREQFPLGLFKYSSKIENYICSILCIRYIF